MVVGLDRFRTHFAEYINHYVLIGGAACTVAMDAAGMPFRATKDLDIVLCVEAIDANFVEAFWKFLRDGGYQIYETSTGHRQFYRFQKPSDNSYPLMLELFSRAPDVLTPMSGSHLTPIPMDEEVSSLSAILMDDAYYEFLQSGKRDVDGLKVAGAELLITLKARAWLDLREREARGDHVDSRDIKKHKNDVFRLARIADGHSLGLIPPVVKEDLANFLARVGAEGIDLKPLGFRDLAFDDVASRLRSIYGLD